MQHRHKTVEGHATACRILSAAEEQFAAQGIAGARTDQIAAAAHANKAMLHYYFGDKGRLHRAVLENLFRQLRAGVYAQPKTSGSAREMLHSFVARYFDFLATHPNYPRLVHREAMERTRNFDWIVREYLPPFFKQLTIKSTGIEGIYTDVLILLGFSGLMVAGSVMLFKRQL